MQGPLTSTDSVFTVTTVIIVLDRQLGGCGMPSRRSPTGIRRLRVGVATLAASAALLSACGGSADTPRAESGAPTALTTADWDTLVEDARTEGQVLVYSSLPETEVAFKRFEQAFPGVTVTVERAPTADLVARLDQEIEVGAPGADVTFNAQTAWFDERSAAGDFAAVSLGPEAVANGWENRLEGQEAAEVYAYPYFLARNTQTAPAVSTLGELVGQAAGKQVGILSPSAAPAVAYQYQLWREQYGDDIFERLAGEANVTEEMSMTPLAQSLAAGEFDYIIGMIPGSLDPLIAGGAPVEEIVPTEAQSGPVYQVAALATAQHPKAAQLFVNWMLSTSAQELLIEDFTPGSVPLDVAGSIPWGSVQPYDPAVWDKTRWDQWIADEWTPLFA